VSGDANRFFRAIEGVERLKDGELIDLFVYYLTVEKGDDVATPRSVDQCFRGCDLSPPARTRAHLSEGLKSAPQKFVRAIGGYKLQHHYRELLSKRLGAERVVAQVSVELRRLEARLPEGSKKVFLQETIDCFEARANRATVIMCWILTMDHLFELVITKHLQSFNAALARVTDKRVKISNVANRDDFGDIPENKFIELLRAAGIISNDVRKILDQKLGTRNSCAHPSGVTIKGSKVIDFVEDLVDNVILKYPI
jgi:hypothetical protein